MPFCAFGAKRHWTGKNDTNHAYIIYFILSHSLPRSNQNRRGDSEQRNTYRRQPDKESRDSRPHNKTRDKTRDKSRDKSRDSSPERSDVSSREGSADSAEREDPKHPVKRKQRDRRRGKKLEANSPVV